MATPRTSPNPPPVAMPIQLEAMAKYPELGRAGSPFNREFLARMWCHAAGDRTIFQNERWPVALADEVAAAGLPSVKTALAYKTPPPPRGIGPASSRCQTSIRTTAAPADAPLVVQNAVAAGNLLQNKPYKWGGGHGSLEDWGYDCSGSVSYVLMKSGLLGGPLTSGSFATYGDPGQGRWITIFAGPGHVFMSVCGLRLDTGGRRGIGESGPRWSPYPRYASGFVARHPPGF